MKNLYQNGETLTYTNAGSAILSGAVVVVGSQLMIATTDIATGATGELAATGVYEVPKVAGVAIVQGDEVMYDLSGLAFTASSATPASGDVNDCCIAWEAAASAAVLCIVKINVGVGTVTA